MAFRFAVGSKVQALDETGHWESAKVLRVFQDAALVRFDGYKAVDDRVVPRVDIRSPEAYHKTVEVTGKRNSAPATPMASVQVSSLLKRRGTDDPITVWVEGVKTTAALMVVDRFRYTVTVLCEGNTKILPWQSVVVDEEESGTEEEEDLAKEEKEEEEPKVQAQLKRRRKRKHSEVLVESSQSEPKSVNPHEETGSLFLKRKRVGQLYNVVGSPVVMAVKSFDTGAKTATCHMVHDHVDQHIVCQVPVDRLGTCTKKPLGAADKRLVSNWFNDALQLTTGLLGDPAYREAFRKEQVAALVEAEVQAALKKAPVKRRFELGLVYPDLEPPFLGMEGMTTTYSYKAEAKDLDCLDMLLGPQWDIATNDLEFGGVKYVTALTFALDQRFSLTGHVTTALARHMPKPIKANYRQHLAEDVKSAANVFAQVTEESSQGED